MSDISDTLNRLDLDEQRLLKNRYTLSRKAQAYGNLMVRAVEVIADTQDSTQDDTIRKHIDHYQRKRQECYQKIRDRDYPDDFTMIVQGPDSLTLIAQSQKAIRGNMVLLQRYAAGNYGPLLRKTG